MFGPEYARACGAGALEPLGIALPDKNYPGARRSSAPLGLSSCSRHMRGSSEAAVDQQGRSGSTRWGWRRMRARSSACGCRSSSTAASPWSPGWALLCRRAARPHTPHTATCACSDDARLHSGCPCRDDCSFSARCCSGAPSVRLPGAARFAGRCIHAGGGCWLCACAPLPRGPVLGRGLAGPAGCGRGLCLMRRSADGGGCGDRTQAVVTQKGPVENALDFARDPAHNNLAAYLGR